MSEELDVRITVPKQYFKLRGPLVTATHVQVLLGEALKRVESVRVNTLALGTEMKEILTGDPGVDRLAYLTYGALKQLGYKFTDYTLIQSNAEHYKIRVYGAEPVDTSQSDEVS